MPLTLYAIGKVEDDEGRVVGLRLATTKSAAEGWDIHRSAVVSRIGGTTPSWIVETAYFDHRSRGWAGSRIRVCAGKWLRTDTDERSSDKLDEIPVAGFSGAFASPEELGVEANLRPALSPESGGTSWGDAEAERPVQEATPRRGSRRL